MTVKKVTELPDKEVLKEASLLVIKSMGTVAADEPRAKNTTIAATAGTVHTSSQRVFILIS
jgi:hypothetical protein